MSYCPRCRDEFQDWVKTCPDCRVALVAELPITYADQTQAAGKSTKAQAPDETRLVTVAVFSFPTEAHVAKSKLDSEGVWSFLADDIIVGTNWLYSNAVCGVKLQVKEEDESKAHEILNRKANPVELDPDVSGEACKDERCPECGSLDVLYERFAMRPLFLSWLISAPLTGGGIALPFLRRKWKCKSCGRTWKASKLQKLDRAPDR